MWVLQINCKPTTKFSKRRNLISYFPIIFVVLGEGFPVQLN
jgi:hypothetical protein